MRRSILHDQETANLLLKNLPGVVSQFAKKEKMSYAKKGIQWYDSMPMDMQIIYLDRITDDQLDYVYNMQFENFADFLAESFVWDHTPEGFDYWLEVSKHNFYEAI